jgi:O-antigen ligase
MSINIFSIFIFICLVLPSAIDTLFLKVALLLVLGINGAKLLLQRRIDVLANNSSVIWLILYCLHGLIFSLLGWLRHGEGWVKTIQVHVFWPIYFYVCLAGLRSSELRKIIYVSARWASLVISLLSILLLLCAHLGLGIYQEYVKIIGFGGIVGVDSMGSIFGFTLPGLVSCPFIIGFTLGKFLILDWRRMSLFQLLEESLLSILAVLSGRFALLLVVLFGPIIAILLHRGVRPIKNKMRTVKSSSLIGLLTVLFFLLVSAIIFLSQGFIDDFSRGGFDESNSGARLLQAEILLKGFWQHPLLGVGLGVSHPELIRSSDTPWSYELTYLAMLYQTGILGFCSYVALVSVPALKLIVMLRDGENYKENRWVFPILVGYIFVLIANSTNPYLNRFDAVWIIVIMSLLAENLAKKQNCIGRVK